METFASNSTFNWKSFFKLLCAFFILVLLSGNGYQVVEASVQFADALDFTTLQFASTDIQSVAVYETGDKVFVGDAANHAIIVLDGTTNQVVDTIPAVPGGGGGRMIVNETYGKAYFYTSTNTGVLDADTNQVLSLSLPSGYLVHDEVHDKLYIVDGNATDYTVQSLDIGTDTVSLLYSGSGNFGGAEINPVTNELAVLIYYPAGIDFINVDTLAVNSFDIAATGGNHALDFELNTVENKYYTTLMTIPGQAEMGIFIFDRDTDLYSFVGQADLEPLVFNPESNTLFSGVQIGTTMGVVDGVTDRFTLIDVRVNRNAGHGAGAVRYSTDHGYFTSQNQVAFVDNLFKTVDFISLPIEPRGGAVASDIAVQQSSGKVYVIADNQSGKVFVLQDPPADGVGTMIQDAGFESGASNPYWMQYSSLGYDNPLICDEAGCGGAGAHTGSAWASFGGWADYTEMSQTGIIPGNAPMLSFWLRIPFAGIFNHSDSLVLQIDGDTVFTVTGEEATAYGTYQKVNVDISAYADGGVHKLKFISIISTSSASGSIFSVDDIEFETSGTTNLLRDPSFEAYTPNPYWTEASTNFETLLCTLADCDGVGARTGSVWAWFGGSYEAETGSLSQTVTIPGGSATLEFYFWIGGAQAGSSEEDLFTAKIDEVTVFSANATQTALYPGYTLVSVDVSAYADGAAHTVTFSSVTSGQVVNFHLDDVALRSIDYTISGTVFADDGVTPLEHIYVGVSGPNYFGYACTDASGQYTFSDLPLEVELQVQASPPWAYCVEWSDYVQEFWPEAAMPDNASSIMLTEENPERTNINFTLDAGGVISGTTYASDGTTPLPRIAISFQNDSSGYFQSVCSDENGQYALHGTPFNMPLRVRADAYQDDWCDAGGQYHSQYWGESLDNGPALLTVTEAAPTQPGIDFAMDPVGSDPIPYLAVWPQAGIVEAFDWPEGAHLRLKIEDLTTPLSPDYSAEVNVTGSSPTLTTFNVMDQFEIEPGMIVMVSGAYLTKIVTVDPVTITNIDQDLDTISGTTAPNTWMWMLFECTPGCRSTVANESGDWTIDYSVLGPNGEGIKDIGSGSAGAVHVPSGEGRTSVSWAVPDPNIDAWYLDGLIEAFGWPMGTHLTLKIEDLTTLLSPDYTAETDVMGTVPWDPSTPYASFEVDDSFEIEPGMVVSVSGEYMTRKITVDHLTITNIDEALNTISGTTGANNWMWMFFEPSCCRPIVADAQGNWFVDYSVLGPNNEPVADIGPDSSGAIHVPSGNGRTSVAWAVRPKVSSITRVGPDPTSAASVQFTVTFSEPVTNVDASDFSVSTTGTLNGVTIGEISGSDSTRTITVNIGSGTGTLQLNVRADASVHDLAGNLIEGLPFTSGQFYTIASTWYIRGAGPTMFGMEDDLPVPADYNGDGKADIAVFRPSNNTWYIRGLGSVVHGAAGDIPVVADYTGDGKADIAVFRPSNNTWYIRGLGSVVYGAAGDIPVIADYTGDGKADIAVFRPSNNTWYIRGVGSAVYGGAGDIPVVGDYTGDGKADIAVFRPGNNTWYIRGVGSAVYGGAGDIPVVGDYTGDGKADIAVFRPSNNTWYIRGVGSAVYGASGDIPVVGDYTGDGKADIAVFRP